MKSTGIVRKIDPLGRVDMPMELRIDYKDKFVCYKCIKDLR